MEDAGKHIDIYYFSSTHWDREWYQPFQEYRFRLVNMINSVTEHLKNNKYPEVFHLDGQTIVLKDYLEVEKEIPQSLTQLLRDGRIRIGPWYVMPDEFLVSGESIIKNMMKGIRICKEFNIQAMKYGYICDIFGHTPQMPQIFNGFGIHHALLARGVNEHEVPAFFRWQSPDGSFCITHKPNDQGGYGSFFWQCIYYYRRDKLTRDQLKEKIRDYIAHEISRAEVPVVVIMDGQDHNAVNKEIELCVELVQELYPYASIHTASIEDMSRQLEKYENILPTVEGELHSPGKYHHGEIDFLHVITYTLSSRYDLKKQNDICQNLLEKWVNPLSTMFVLKGYTFKMSYLDIAYDYLIKNHPHDSICGCSIDQVHRDMHYRFDQCRIIGNKLIYDMLEWDKSLLIQNYDDTKVENDSDQSSIFQTQQRKLLKIYNPLVFRRKEVVTVDIEFETDYKTKFAEPISPYYKNSFKIIDCEGNELPYGLVDVKRKYPVRQYDGAGIVPMDIHTVSFEADLPPMGTAEYSILPFNQCSRYLSGMSQSFNTAQNEYIRLTVNHDGTFNLTDLQNYKEYSNLMNFFDDSEVGDGWWHVKSINNTTISSIGAPCTIEKKIDNCVQTQYKITKTLHLPRGIEYGQYSTERSREYAVLEICSYVTLYKGARYVDVRLNINNGVKDHRLTVNFPTGIHGERFFANQMFCMIDRTTGIDISKQTWKECDVPERAYSGIIGKKGTDGEGLAVISAYGLHECSCTAEGDMGITLLRSFSKTFGTAGGVDGQLQEELEYNIRIYPIRRDSTYADLFRLQDSLQAGVKYFTANTGISYEPSVEGPIIVCSNPDIVVSTIKLAEDNDNSLIIRFFNTTGCTQAVSFTLNFPFTRISAVDLNEEEKYHLTAYHGVVSLDIGKYKIESLKVKL